MTLNRNPHLLNRRNTLVSAGVVVAHALLLWLLLNAAITPHPPSNVLEIEAAWIVDAPTAPQAPASPTAAKSSSSQQKRAAPAKSAAKVTTAQSATPSPAANSAPAQPAAGPSESPAAQPQAVSGVAAAASKPAPVAEPKVELPSSSADFLSNPPPPYPALSKRLREEGAVVVNVLIGTDGTASQPEIATSSGYHRLDQAALKAVLSWRYVPGKRNGVPTAMRYDVPVNFRLTDK